MNLGGAQPTVGMAQVLENDDDDAVDPHLERIKNEAGGDESDEEVPKSVFDINLYSVIDGTALLFLDNIQA